MKMLIGKKVYDQFGDEDRAGLKPVPCDCIEYGKPDDECEVCDGGGTVYEWALSAEDAAAIEENLRSQGVPLGKSGAN